jgi:hypothetical protein
MPVSKRRNPVIFSYLLAGAVLDRASSINNLRVIMDEKINFLKHVNVMVGNMFAMLGLIRTLSIEFRDPYTMRSFYTPLVDP